MNNTSQGENLNEIYDLIFSKDFGKPKKTEFFLKSIKQLNHKQRVTSILNHYLEIDSIRKRYEIAKKLICVHSNFFWNSEDENITLDSRPLYNPNDPLSTFSYIEIIDGFYTKCMDFLTFYLEGTLAKELNIALCNMYHSYSLHNLEKKINEKQSIIIHNDDLTELSPLLFPFNLWKEIITHDLSIPDNHQKINLAKHKVIGQIKELEYHIGNNKIPNNLDNFFHHFKSEDNDSLYFFRLDYGGFNAEDFTNLIENYLSFIYNLKENNIIKISKQNLIDKLKKEEERKAKLLESDKTRKLLKPEKINEVIKGLTYLIKKSNHDIECKIVNNIATETVYCLFDNKTASENVQKSKIDFANSVLVDYIIFLAKYNYIKLHKNITFYPKLLSERIPFKMKGSGEKRLYQLLNKKLSTHLMIIDKEKEDFSNIDLNFNGLTSERALKNEMKN